MNSQQDLQKEQLDSEILVFIEIAKNTNIKYEYDKELNAIICDRILYTPFSFPFNYGFIPNTLSGDGDPLDALVYMEQPLVPGCYIKCRIIGCLETVDENGEDAKLIVTEEQMQFIQILMTYNSWKDCIKL